MGKKVPNDTRNNNDSNKMKKKAKGKGKQQQMQLNKTECNKKKQKTEQWYPIVSPNSYRQKQPKSWLTANYT